MKCRPLSKNEVKTTVEWGAIMFKDLFATMHEMLEEIMTQWKTADGKKRRDLDRQVTALQQISDECMEEWLHFEEKLGRFRRQVRSAADPTWNPQAAMSEPYQKGEGYFKLWMYREAISCFKEVVRQYPEFVMARLYLALGFMEIHEHEEARRHLERVLPMAKDAKMKAVAYHALGCIEIRENRPEQACEYFRKARKTDPTLSYYSLS